MGPAHFTAAVGDALARVDVDGSTDVRAAIAAAYGAANDTFVIDGINSVVLVTDGTVPAGSIDLDEIEQGFLQAAKQSASPPWAWAPPPANSTSSFGTPRRRVTARTSTSTAPPPPTSSLHLRFDELHGHGRNGGAAEAAHRPLVLPGRGIDGPRSPALDATLSDEDRARARARAHLPPEAARLRQVVAAQLRRGPLPHRGHLDAARYEQRHAGGAELHAGQSPHRRRLPGHEGGRHPRVCRCAARALEGSPPRGRTTA